MFRFVIAACIVLLCVAAPVRAESLAGMWECTAVSTEVSHWTMDVREAKNKITGTVSDGVAVFPLIDPRIHGENLIFKLNVDGNIYAVELKIDTGKLEGKYSGPEATGTLKCKRQ